MRAIASLRLEVSKINYWPLLRPGPWTWQWESVMMIGGRGAIVRRETFGLGILRFLNIPEIIKYIVSRFNWFDQKGCWFGIPLSESSTSLFEKSASCLNEMEGRLSNCLISSSTRSLRWLHSEYRMWLKLAVLLQVEQKAGNLNSYTLP